MPVAKPDIKGIRLFLHYRKLGLSYRDISLIMKKPLKTLTRWNNYIVTNKVVDNSIDVDK